MEALIYIAVVAIGYIIWVKIKAFFTGRTWSEQVAHDDARKRERVCRNCKHCWGGHRCLKYDQEVDGNNSCCGSFNR